MAKPTLEDIIINKKRRKLEVLSRTARGRDDEDTEENSIFERKVEREKRSIFGNSRGLNRHEISGGRKRPTYGLIITVVVSFVILVFALSLFFVGATVTVYPKQKSFSFNKLISASKDGQSSVRFETIELEGKDSVPAEARGKKELKKKASGTIVVYNAYNSKSQKLIKNTRFETPDGKVYRIDAPITVPGTTISGGKIVPGSIEVVVYADEPGENYNIGKTDFTLPGFKGDPRYTKFYARSKTDMTGGFVGSVYAVSDVDASDAKLTLKKRLTDSLLKEARKTIPAEFILYDDATFFDFEDIKIIGEEGAKTVNIEQNAKLYAVIFQRTSLAKYIAQVGIDNFDGSPVYSLSLDTLSFAMEDKEEIDYKNINKISFTLSGDVLIFWDFNQKNLIKDLLGKPKKNFQSILSKYTGIDRADLSVDPFWAQAMPDKEGQIKIKIITK